MTNHLSRIDRDALRLRAEQLAARTSLPPLHPSPDHGRLYHELQVHQIELEIQNDELRQANAELQSLCAERQGLYQALLHELAHPALALGLFLDALRRTTMTAEQVHLVAQLTRGVQILGELSRDLSELGKPGIQEFEEPVLVALEPFLDRLLDDYGPVAAQHALTLHRVPTRLNVMASPSLLWRIIGNVLANAIRRAESASLLLGARSLERNSVRIEIWSCDVSAPGHALPQIGRDDAEHEACGLSERCPFSGEGLELSVAHRLAEVLGLTIKMYSTQAGGSVVYVTVPRQLRGSPRRHP